MEIEKIVEIPPDWAFQPITTITDLEWVKTKAQKKYGSVSAAKKEIFAYLCKNLNGVMKKYDDQLTIEETAKSLFEVVSKVISFDHKDKSLQLSFLGIEQSWVIKFFCSKDIQKCVTPETFSVVIFLRLAKESLVKIQDRHIMHLELDFQQEQIKHYLDSMKIENLSLLDWQIREENNNPIEMEKLNFNQNRKNFVS